MVTQYYNILGVRQYASKDEVKKAFRLKAKTLHPDVSENPESQLEFLKVQQAYEMLMKYSVEELITMEYLHSQQKTQQNYTPQRPRAQKKIDPNFQKFTLKQDTRLKYIKNLFIFMLSLTMLCLPLTFFIDEKELNPYVFFTSFSIIFICGILYTKGMREKYNPNKTY